MSFEFRDDGTIDRRIGSRALADGIEVMWLVPRSPASLRKKPREQAGTVMNVSLTGAAIRGPADLPFAVGATVLIRYEGRDSSVVIRRSEPTRDAAMHLYGVELQVVHPLLQERIARQVADARNQALSGVDPPAEDTFLL